MDLDPSEVEVWFIQPDKTPRPAPTLAEGRETEWMIEEGDDNTSCGPETNCSNGSCVHLMKCTLRRRGQWTHEDV